MVEASIFLDALLGFFDYTSDFFSGASLLNPEEVF